MYKTEIIEKNRTTVLYAEGGECLSDILIENGFYVDMPCGGNGSCGKCAVTVNGKTEHACRYRINSDITVVLPERSNTVSDYNSYKNEKTENICLALDIGTTTLALALVTAENGKAVRTLGCANSQRVFGADIMARIDYCRKNGVEKLQNAVINDINRLVEKLNLIGPLPLYVAGNTTMLHIFFGMDCVPLGVAPYAPVFLDSKRADGKSLGLKNVLEVISIPCISAFAGADITAGLNYVDLPAGGKYNMLVDLGTNAEIALYNGSCCLCTSAAAGPCFEGANISCGMSAVDGAVYAYKDGRAQVVGGGAAKGICGTGLIDVVAFMLEKGIADSTGFMQCAEYEIADGVSVTQDDIRQYQLAKSAVFSAICVLIENAKLSYDDIGTVFISGGFSEGFSTDSAVKTGLIPDAIGEKCVAAGNSSLKGVIKYIHEGGKLPAFIGKAQYIDLSTDAGFSKAFIENMKF